MTHPDGIIPIAIPLPFALKSVNCYLVRGADGWALIDTGIGWPPALEAWRAALRQHDLHPRDIVAIYVTHNHPDHVGLAGWWQRESGAPVLMPRREAEITVATWSDGARTAQALAEHFAAYGLPAALSEPLGEHVQATQRMLLPLPEVTPLDFSAEALRPVSVAGRAFQALTLPGHSDAQLLLYEPATRALLCADHVLPRISPNIGVWATTPADPLRRYLASFEQLETLEVAVALPGHGEPFTDLRGRLTALRAHHQQRLEEMLAVVRSLGRPTAYEVCRRVFPEAQLTPAQIQFALGETIAHLDYLVGEGLLQREAGPPLRYLPTQPPAVGYEL